MALTEACYAAAILHVRAGAVSSIDDIRAQLRASPNPAPEGKPFFLLATVLVGALASGVFYYLFFMPVVVPLKPSPHLPTFHRVNPDGTPENPPPDLRVEPAPPNPSQYAGLSPRQAGKVADDVCFARAQARVPHWSKTPRLTTKELADFDFDEMPHFNELLTCLLTEAPVRYCSSGQRSMIKAEIAMYFRGIDYGNKTPQPDRAAQARPRRPSHRRNRGTSAGWHTDRLGPRRHRRGGARVHSQAVRRGQALDAALPAATVVGDLARFLEFSVSRARARPVRSRP
jgi:hypothetical protein